MLDFSALQAFCVKMLSAIASGTNILVNIASQLLAAKHSNHVGAAQLGEPTIKATLALRTVSVKPKTKLVHRELTIGMLLKKSHQLLLALGLIGLSLRDLHFLSSNLRIILKLYHSFLGLSREN